MTTATVEKADSATVIDGVEVPAGWRLLPAGQLRQVRVLAKEIEQSERPVFRVFEPGGWDFTCAHEVRVLGPARFIHDPDAWWCGKQGTAYVETEAAVLVRLVKAV